MNRKGLPVIFIFLVLLLLTCKTQGKAEPSKVNLKGMVKIYGSEPNTWVGIESVPGGKIYTVTPTEKAAELRVLQGYLLEFTVIIQDTDLLGLDGTATLLSWQFAQ